MTTELAPTLEVQGDVNNTPAGGSIVVFGRAVNGEPLPHTNTFDALARKHNPGARLARSRHGAAVGTRAYRVSFDNGVTVDYRRYVWGEGLYGFSV